MGKVFSFVVSDVHEKNTILINHQKSETDQHYNTVKDMIMFEVENNITVVHGRHKPPSGCRTLLRLHRALEFIIEFLDKLSLAGLEDQVSSIGHKAYNSTLHHYHPWIVRQGVNLAMYTLPTVQSLIKIMAENNGHQLDYESSQKALKNIVQAAQPVYDLTQEMYKSNGILDLP